MPRSSGQGGSRGPARFQTAASGAYKFVLVLHVLCAIIGFGANFLNALYGREVQRRQGREGLAIAEANFNVGQVGEYFISTVAVFGILLVLLSDDVYEFTDTFIWLSIVLYIISRWASSTA